MPPLARWRPEVHPIDLHPSMREVVFCLARYPYDDLGGHAPLAHDSKEHEGKYEAAGPQAEDAQTLVDDAAEARRILDITPRAMSHIEPPNQRRQRITTQACPHRKVQAPHVCTQRKLLYGG